MDNLGPAAVAITSQWCSWLFAFVWTRIGGELLGRWAADPGPRLGDAAGNARLGAGATLRCAERVRGRVNPFWIVDFGFWIKGDKNHE